METGFQDIKREARTGNFILTGATFMSTAQVLRIKKFPPEWVNWVRENYDLGVSTDVILATLIDHGFDEQSSIRVIDALENGTHHSIHVVPDRGRADRFCDN